MKPEQEAFLEVLAEDEDDAAARSIYADWLDDDGQSDEANRQRAWPAAKKWLLEFVDENNVDKDDLSYISYEELIDQASNAAKNSNEGKGPESVYIFLGTNEKMEAALNAHPTEFWRNWAIVTGNLLPKSMPVSLLVTRIDSDDDGDWGCHGCGGEDLDEDDPEYCSC